MDQKITVGSQFGFHKKWLDSICDSNGFPFGYQKLVGFNSGFQLRNTITAKRMKVNEKNGKEKLSERRTEDIENQDPTGAVL